MASLTASRRYAKAVLLLADEGKQADRILSDMQGVRSTIEASSELRALLTSPVVKPDVKITILKEVFKSSSELVIRLIDLLGERQRLNLLPLIATNFESLYNDANGIADVMLTSATALDSDQNKAVQKAMELKTGKKIRIQSKVDASLIGGITVQMGDTMYDGSVRHSLEKLEMLLHSPIA